MAKTFTKQPSEVFDYDIKMETYLESLGDEILAGGGAAVVTVDKVTVPPLELGPGVHPDWETVGDPRRRLKIWVGGGKDGEKYKITAQINTEVGRLEETEFYIKVKET